MDKKRIDKERKTDNFNLFEENYDFNRCDYSNSNIDKERISIKKNDMFDESLNVSKKNQILNEIQGDLNSYRIKDISKIDVNETKKKGNIFLF